MYTRHGHWTGLGEPTEPAPLVYDCGGPHLCPQCALEAQRYSQKDPTMTSLADNDFVVDQNRYPATVHLSRQFRYSHLPDELQVVSRQCHDLAMAMIRDLPDSPELSFGLRQLLLAKDAFVRCAVERNGAVDG